MNEIKDQQKIINESVSDIKETQHEPNIFKDAYHDSYLFEELSSFEPLEWVNIPKPLQLALISIKKCLLSNNKTLNEVCEKTHQMSNRSRKKFEEIDYSLINAHNKLDQNYESIIKTLQDSKENLEKDLSLFKSNINKDLDFKQKIIDGKISYIEEQVFTMKKFVSTLPISEEIDKRIKNSTESMRERVKYEINENYIKPEMINVNDLFNEIHENTLKFNQEYEEFKNIISNKFQESLASQSNSIQNVLESIKNNNEKLSNKIKTLSQQSADQAEKNIKSIESLNAIFHENNHNYFLEFKVLKKEIAEQKVNQKNYSEEIENLKKEVKDQIQILNQTISEDKSSENLIPEHIYIDNHPAVEHLEHQIAENHITNNIETKVVENQTLENQIIEEKKAEPPKQIVQQIKLEPQKPKVENKIVRGKKTSLTVNDDFAKKLGRLQKYTDEKINLLENKLNHEIDHYVMPLEKKLKESIINNESELCELKEKLAWLPINLSQIHGKSPTEARVFTLEARLRAEENSRLENFNKLFQMINMMQSTSPEMDGFLPQIRALSVTRNNTYSQNSGLVSESIRMNAESELGKKDKKSFLNLSMDHNPRTVYGFMSPSFLKSNLKNASFLKHKKTDPY